MNIFVLTLFPEMVDAGLMHGVLKRGVDRGIVGVECVNIRDFAENKHARVDDYPYGGGVGMVMAAPPVYGAYMSVRKRVSDSVRVICMTPQGETFSQKTAAALSNESDLIIICGRYEGIDERVIEEIVTDEISIGDFILTGGELPAMVLIDAVCRLVPGVLGKEESFQTESFSGNLLEYPQYTRPEEWRGRKVPEVLLSGHHKNVELWRAERAAERTAVRRPDLTKK